MAGVKIKMTKHGRKRLKERVKCNPNEYESLLIEVISQGTHLDNFLMELRHFFGGHSASSGKKVRHERNFNRKSKFNMNHPKTYIKYGESIFVFATVYSRSNGKKSMLLITVYPYDVNSKVYYPTTDTKAAT